MLRVDEKGEQNEYPKEYREVEETKAITAKAKGSKRKDSTVRYTVNGPRGKKKLHRTTKLVERCRRQGKHILRSTQETKRKGLIKTLVVQSEGMENLRETSCFLNKFDERRLQA